MLLPPIPGAVSLSANLTPVAAVLHKPAPLSHAIHIPRILLVGLRSNIRYDPLVERGRRGPFKSSMTRTPPLRSDYVCNDALGAKASHLASAYAKRLKIMTRNISSKPAGWRRRCSYDNTTSERERERAASDIFVNIAYNGRK